jgi:diguanylate cyclase (GGDEF)-like protein
MDMDRLKQVNDSRGHRKGDQVLTLLARSIVKRLRGTDKCFRTGGDEFVVIAQSDPTAYRHRFTALAKDVNQALVSGGFPETGMSWGLASREEVESLDALIPLADSRMYDNKRTRCSPRAAPPALGSKQMPLP